MSWDDPLPGRVSSYDDDIIYAPSDVKKPPKWPVVTQAVLILLSVAIFATASVQRYFITSLIGYLLTPFLVVALLAFLRATDLSNRSLPWYDKERGRQYLRVAGILALVAFVVAAPVIWRLAVEVSQELGI